MLPLILIVLTACTGDDSGTDTAGGDSAQGSTGATDSGTTNESVKYGCLTGRLRDINNNSAGELAIEAFAEEGCETLSTTTTAADGTFCLEGLPVGESVVVQATFTERCSWAHGKTVSVPITGACDTANCAELDTWYECDGESASCP